MITTMLRALLYDQRVTLGLRSRAQYGELLITVGLFVGTPDQARLLTELSDFVNTHMPQSAQLFVGLHRHDVVIIGDVMIYFILNHPIATRYHELHPAITDTAQVQHEIIRDL